MLQTKCLEQCPASNKYSICINTHSSTKDIKFEANKKKKNWSKWILRILSKVIYLVISGAGILTRVCLAILSSLLSTHNLAICLTFHLTGPLGLSSQERASPTELHSPPAQTVKHSLVSSDLCRIQWT